MSRIIVRSDKNTKKLVFEVSTNGKLNILQRSYEETVGRTIERLQATLTKSTRKKVKNKKMKLDEVIEDNFKSLLLNQSNEEISMETAGFDAWNKASRLIIKNESFQILYNTPKICSLDLSGFPFVSVPLYPLVSFKDASSANSKFVWFRRKFLSIEEVEISKRDLNSEEEDETPMECEDNEDWQQISNNPVYIPTEKDLDFVLKLVVKPGSEEIPAENHYKLPYKTVETKNVVSIGPGKLLYQYIPKVEEFCASKEGFRLVCYNILADCYTSTENAKTDIFPYVDEEYMSIHYRLPLILKELTAYNGDIVALQECDRFIFEEKLVPIMSIQNYAGAFACKGSSKEGVTLFFKKHRFKMMESQNCIFGHLLRNNEIDETTKKLLSDNKYLKEQVEKKGSCGLICLVKDVIKDEYLIIANTHLYFHPRASNIRILQTYILICAIQNMMNKTKEKYETNKISYILCGDFNSFPLSGVCSLVENGVLSENHTDWYSQGIIGHPVKGETDIKHDLNFTNILQNLRSYTNYAAGFYAHLDHIFVSTQSLKASKILDQPPHNKVTEYTALPSKIQPSDHIAQVADIQYLS